MPVIDLHGILGPIVSDVVAPLVFPDVVDIQEPTHTPDSTGDPQTTWQTVIADVEAVIAPANQNTGNLFINVPIMSTDVTILMPGDLAIEGGYRIAVQGSGDVWDVEGVKRDEARVTTTVLGRNREPGTPDEGTVS